MQSAKHTISGFTLITLALLMLGLVCQEQIQAANRSQTTLPPTTPCFIQTLDDFTLEVLGYRTIATSTV